MDSAFADLGWYNKSLKSTAKCYNFWVEQIVPKNTGIEFKLPDNAKPFDMLNSGLTEDWYLCPLTTRVVSSYSFSVLVTSAHSHHLFHHPPQNNKDHVILQG